MSYGGIVGLPPLDDSILAQSRRQSPQHQELAATSDDTASIQYELPPFIRILNSFLVHTQAKESSGANNFITNVAALHDVAFSAKCPILGTGHHFAVYASSLDSSEDDFKPVDGRAFNNEVYCLKAPNFASVGSDISSPDKAEMCKEYYNTVLQELRVLLHPDLRSHDNIISLFGLDFQQDYDDRSIAWPVLLMENAEFGTLDTLQLDIHLDSDLSRVLLLDVARGIQALHKCNIIHGDVKSENVLICRHHTRPYVARLSDFGLSLINPDVSRQSHRLPGGTFLWRSPEFDHDLSVEGLRQTDIYSFGLMAWRVLVSSPSPYGLIPPAALGLQASARLNEVVSRAKAHPDFTRLLLETMERAGVPQVYALRIVEATLGKDPASRDLARAISVLSSDRTSLIPTCTSRLEPNEAYWATETPLLVMEQIEEAFPESLLPYTLKASMIRSLIGDLEVLFKYTGALARIAGWLLFKFAASPLFHAAWRDVDECCRILIQLCQVDSALGQSIVVRYHEIYGRTPSALEPEWLEVAASNGSCYALESLRECYPEKYLQLMSGPLDIEPRSADLEEDEVDLLRSCRLGDFEACKMMLQNGASAFPSQKGMVSALHWLISFRDERQINELLVLLLGNGAVLDAWEGEDDEFVLGRVHGTPLHWAIWHRNIPVVRALTEAESWPEVEQVNRAIWLAATMHFYDVMEILKAWILGSEGLVKSDINWYPPFLFAADESATWLPRRLHHGADKPSAALERTMDVILSFYDPSTEDLKLMFTFGKGHNQPALLRYMYSRLGLGKHKELSKIIVGDPGLEALAMGFIGIVEVFIENGIISPQSEHGSEKWRPLQVCCFTRQSDPVFASRLLEIGCPVDGIGSTEESSWTPFLIAVAVGMYEIAVLFLERGANKDHLAGWAGGSTVTMNLLQSWPDIPLSRLKFLLEEVPRLGFGHVTFWGWPGAGGNLLYALSLDHWSSYSSGYRLVETAKYILSQLADKSCLNTIDKVGATALRMACANGNLEIIRVLIDAGQDVNLAFGFSPLKNAKNWLAKCQAREKQSLKEKAGSERRLARLLRERAQETIDLLISHGAIDRGTLEALQQGVQFVASGQWQKPSFETVFELLSGEIDPSPRVEAGSTPLTPMKRGDLRAHNGKKSATQMRMGTWGRQMDQANAKEAQKPTPRYQAHNCHPWRSDNCVSCSPPAPFPANQALAVRPRVAQSQPFNTPPTHLRPENNRPPATQWFPSNQVPSVLRGLAAAIPPLPQLRSPSRGRPSADDLARAQYLHPPSWQPAASSPVASSPVARSPGASSPVPLGTAEAVEKQVYHRLLQYFCEGGGEQAGDEQRRVQAVGILKKEFHAPLRLPKTYRDTERCEEFFQIDKATRACFEMMNISGVTLVPELSDDGNVLFIHVFS